MDKGTPPPPGLLASLAAVARGILGLALSRLELAALELGEVRNHLLRLVVMFALAVVAGCFALAYGTVTIVYLAWDALGWKILLIMTGAFMLAALGLILCARSMIRSGKLSLTATMAELKSDRDMLL
jgi:uncharacterized membrane protein YqjE